MADYSLIDLHTHTEYSHEGMCDDTVFEVLSEAQEVAQRVGKDALVAITDHNTILGVKEARELINSGKIKNVKLLSGAEFTVDMSEINSIFNGRRVFGNCHILAYGFDENNKELVEFSKISAGTGAKIKFSKLVELMRNSGGNLIVAHPGLIKVFPSGIYGYKGKYQDEISSIRSKSKKTILRCVPNGKYLLELFYDGVKRIGGDVVKGFERFHPDNYYREFDKSIESLCEREGLIQTGGSDFHGYHLHTDFSVGNVFTSMFQEFYKEVLQDSTTYRNGLYLSHLPNLERIMGEENTSENKKSDEPKFITANGEEVTYEQYNQVVDAFKEELKTYSVHNTTKRYSENDNNTQRHNSNKKNNHNKNNNKNNQKNRSKKHRNKGSRFVEDYEENTFFNK